MTHAQRMHPRLAVALVVVLVAALVGGPASAARTAFPAMIPLPDGFQPEGIATGHGATFYVGSLADGAIYRGDLRTGAGELLAAGGPDRTAVGIDVDAHERVWVAGGGTGTGSVYDGTTGELLVTHVFAAAGEAFVNDVVVTPDAAYFTDSIQSRLFVVPLGRSQDPATATAAEPLVLDVPDLGFPGLNGIETTPDGTRLVIAHTAAAALYVVDPVDGAASEVDLGGSLVPGGDGLVRTGTRLFVVQSHLNQIAAVELASDGASGAIRDVLRDPALDVPSTAALVANAIYAVNARFATPPEPNTEYSIVRVLSSGDSSTR